MVVRLRIASNGGSFCVIRLRSGTVQSNFSFFRIHLGDGAQDKSSHWRKQVSIGPIPELVSLGQVGKRERTQTGAPGARVPAQLWLQWDCDVKQTTKGTIRYSLLFQPTPLLLPPAGPQPLHESPSSCCLSPRARAPRGSVKHSLCRAISRNSLHIVYEHCSSSLKHRYGTNNGC